MTAPLVSVAMIAYNHRPFIAQALDSALAQQCGFPVEIVVSDDRSPDGTAEIIADYARSHPGRIRQVDPPANLGVAGNLRHVWAACRGKYIALLEGDDYWLDPAKLAQQAALMESRPECVLCGHAARYDAPHDAALHDRRLPEQSLPAVVPQAWLIEDNFLPTASIMIRRDVLPELPPWMASLRILDWPISLFASQSGTIGFIDGVMSVYRVHGGGVFSSQTELRALINTCDALEAVIAHAGEPLRSGLRQRLAGLYRDRFWRHRTLGENAAARRAVAAELRHRLRLGSIPPELLLKAPIWLLHPGLHWPGRLARSARP